MKTISPAGTGPNSHSQQPFPLRFLIFCAARWLVIETLEWNEMKNESIEELTEDGSYDSLADFVGKLTAQPLLYYPVQVK